MTRNIGKADRGLRAVVGIIVLSLGYFYQSYWGAIGLILLGTSATSFCPLYALLGYSSCPAKKSEMDQDILA